MVTGKKGDTLIFFEVKTRTSIDFGFPEEAVTRKKQQHLKFAAKDYMQHNPGFFYIRFDIISIMLSAYKEMLRDQRPWWRGVTRLAVLIDELAHDG